MRRIVGIAVAAVLAVPVMVIGAGGASAAEQDVAVGRSSSGLLGLGGGDGLLGTGLLGNDDRKRSKKSKKHNKRDRRDRDEQANSILGLNLLGGGDDGGLLGLGGDDGLLGTGLLGEEGLLGTGLLSNGRGDRGRDRDRDRSGSKRHYDNHDDDSDIDDDDFPFGD